jgi:peroxiredoxin
VYERYRERGVVFLGMNWEQPGDPNDRIEKARTYVMKNNYTFPVVLDHDRVASESYSISGFPTVFVIDKAGMIRYRNVGVEPGIETILTDQIESLME